MAKYRVNEKGPGYINDRMEQPGAEFVAKDGLKGSWFDKVEDQPVAEVSESDSADEVVADAMENAASEAQGTRPDPALAEAEVAASESEDMVVETL